MNLYRLSLGFIILSVVFVSCIACTEDNSGEEVSLKLNKNELTLKVGETETLVVSASPSQTGTITWTSTNKTVATVFFGKVTALNSGKTTIIAQLGDYIDSCIITVPEREYVLVWEEEFNGNSLNTDYWNIEVNGNGGGNGEAQYYTDRSENLRVADGLLTIEARKETYMNKAYTSARINTKEKKDFVYGKVDVRLKVPKGTGTWAAFWMLGYGSWPSAGEIDIMEHVGYEPKIFHCALHTQNKNGMNGQNEHALQVLPDDAANNFHVITMEWVENEIGGYDRIHIYVDGVKTTTFGETQQLQQTNDWPFNKKFFFIINLAIGGTWGGSKGIDNTIFDNPVLFQIDYIRVYQLR